MDHLRSGLKGHSHDGALGDEGGGRGSLRLYRYGLVQQ